ncbi:transcriptional regulator [Streptomyces sp. TRM68367]|nr:transcriptional regulator [Streptomyces sp. TRM68367]
MNDEARLAKGRQLRPKYEHGATIRALAEEAGLSYWQTRELLLDAGTLLRGRGARIPTTDHRA